MFIADYHTHSNFSSDSNVPMEDLIKSAVSLNLQELAITDHVDFDEHYELIDYNSYIITFNQLKEKYAKNINLIFGVEVGLEHEKSEKLNNFISSFPFDFVIGSSHAVCGYDLYFDNFFENKTKQEAYSIYFQEMLKNINSINDFCVYGHLDFISRYGIYEDNSLNYQDYKDLVDEVLKALIEKNKGLEINTSGYRYNINSPYPQIAILKRYRELGGEIITIGSDSHTSKDVAANFKEAVEILKDAGFNHISLFKNKNHRNIKI